MENLKMKEQSNRWSPTSETKKIAREMLEEEQGRESRWLTEHKNYEPVYPGSNERGFFIGVFGYTNAVGIRYFSYYKTSRGEEWLQRDEEEGE